MTVLKTELEFRPNTYDIDAARHVNNIVYIKWLEKLRCEILASRCCADELLKRNLYPVVTSTQIHYRKQLNLSDRPKGTVCVESVRHGLMRLKVIFRTEDAIIANAEQDCVLIDLETGRMNREAMEIYK